MNARGITYATFCSGPYDESVRYRDFMGRDVPWYSVADSADILRAGRPFNKFFLACYLNNEDIAFNNEDIAFNNEDIALNRNHLPLSYASQFGRSSIALRRRIRR